MLAFQAAGGTLNTAAPVFAAQRATHRFRPQRERQRGKAGGLLQDQFTRLATVEQGGECSDIQLLFHHFAARLLEQKMVGIVLAQHVEQQATGGLQLTQAANRASRQ